MKDTLTIAFMSPAHSPESYLPYAVAADGTAGSGKGAITSRLHGRINQRLRDLGLDIPEYLLIDSGSICRLVTYISLQFYPQLKADSPVFETNISSLVQLLKQSDVIYLDFDTGKVAWDSSFLQEGGGRKVFEDSLLRTPAIDKMVANVSRLEETQNFVRDICRELAKKRPVIIEGRSNHLWFSETGCHPYVDANLNRRSMYRSLQRVASAREKNPEQRFIPEADFYHIRENLAERDRKDKERSNNRLELTEQHELFLNESDIDGIVDAMFAYYEETVGKLLTHQPLAMAQR